MTEQNALVQLSVDEKLLAQFKKDYNEEDLPDVTTKEGYKFIQEGIALVRTHRTGTEKLRQQLVKPLNDKVKGINKICKDMEEELKWIEGPMKRVKGDEDDRLQAIKDAEAEENRKRISRINHRLDSIMQAPIDAMDMTSAEIQVRIDEFDQMDATNPEEGFDEFSQTAQETIDNSIVKLRELHKKTVLAEQQAIEQAEREKREAAEAEKKRIDDEEAERVRKRQIKEQEEENQRKADELAKKEAELKEREKALEPDHVISGDEFKEELKKPGFADGGIVGDEPAKLVLDPEEKIINDDGSVTDSKIAMATKDSMVALSKIIDCSQSEVTNATVLFEAIYNCNIPNIHFKISE